MDFETALLGALIAFLAASTQAVTGFGFAIVFAPLFALAWEPKEAVATTVCLSIVVNIMVLAQIRGHITYGRLPGLYGGYLLGVGPGLLFLEIVSAGALQVTLGVFVVVATLLLYLRPSIDTGHDSLVTRVVAGTASGVSSSATGIGGPPVVLYLIGRELDIDRFRATLIAYFLPISLFTIALFIAVGRIDGDVLVAAGAAVPAIVAGVGLGAWLRSKVDAELFRRLVMGLLLTMSVVVIVLVALGR